MKKYLLVSACALTALVFSYCSGSKKAAKAEPAKVTYTAALSTVIMEKCSPCHIPAKGGNKRPYDNYANVKADIDDIIHRIELNPGQRGFMPMKGEKLPDATIALFKQFKADGSLDK